MTKPFTSSSKLIPCAASSPGTASKLPTAAFAASRRLVHAFKSSGNEGIARVNSLTSSNAWSNNSPSPAAAIVVFFAFNTVRAKAACAAARASAAAA